MNIKQFLLENYIYIIIIILLAIITVIGFLAEKSKGDKKDKKSKKTNDGTQLQTSQQELQQNIQYQQPTEQISNNQFSQNNMINNSQPVINPMGFQVPTENTVNQTIPTPNNFEQMNEGNNSTIQNAPMSSQPDYQQMPIQNQNITSPQPVPNFIPTSNDVNQLQQNIQYQQPMMPNQNLTPNIPTFTISSQEMLNQEQIINPYQQTNMEQYGQNNNQFIQPIPNQGTIPQPIQQIPVPQQVVPQSLGVSGMQPTYDNQQGIINSEQQNGQLPQQPINFVYGNNNNQSNM